MVRNGLSSLAEEICPLWCVLYPSLSEAESVDSLIGFGSGG